MPTIPTYEECGLIGKLYYYVFPANIFKQLNNHSRHNTKLSPIKYFQKEWLGIIGAHDYWTEMSRNGTFPRHCFNDINKYIGSEEDIESQKEDKKKKQKDYEKKIQSELDRMNKLLKEKGSVLDKDECLNKLVKALENTNTFTPYLEPKQDYNKAAKDRLVNHICFARELVGLPHFIRCYISFALCNSVPDLFFENKRTEDDLNDFSKCCIKKFGTTSKHGIMEIIRLAEKGNVIAKCEYADILYYGQVEGVNRDINRAFQLYKEAAGITNVFEKSEKSDLHINAYPQALWSIGHILFNYDNTRVNLALPINEPIIEIDGMSRIERIQCAYTRASQALALASNLPAAANLLGQIAQLTNNDCAKIEDFKKQKHINNCTDYFDEAIKGGWVYAYNNLALEELRQLIIDIKKKRKWKEHILNCLKNLHEAANRYEPWAANTLGQYYLEGIKYRDPETKNLKAIIDSDGIRIKDPNGSEKVYGPIDSFRIINPYTGLEEVVDSIIDPNRAFYYFKKAYEAYSVFSDRYCGWACANLKCYFSDRLSEEELKDIDGIVEKYGQIDKEILERANEKRPLPVIKHGK